MAVAPAFASTPRSLDRAAVTAANTGRDGSGSIVTLATGSAAGFKVFAIVGKAEVTTTAQMARIWLSTDSGTTYDLFDEIEIPAITASASVSSSRIQRNYENLVLTGTTNKIGVTLQAAEAHNFWALGADL